MRETLLNKAKKPKVRMGERIKGGNEEIEVALAWIKDEVSTRQITEAIGKPEIGGRILYRLSI